MGNMYLNLSCFFLLKLYCYRFSCLTINERMVVGFIEMLTIVFYTLLKKATFGKILPIIWVGSKIAKNMLNYVKEVWPLKGNS